MGEPHIQVKFLSGTDSSSDSNAVFLNDPLENHACEQADSVANTGSSSPASTSSDTSSFRQRFATFRLSSIECFPSPEIRDLDKIYTASGSTVYVSQRCMSMAAARSSIIFVDTTRTTACASRIGFKER